MTQQLELGIVVPAFFYVPFWAAERKGFFAQQGLDVTITAFDGIDPLTAALKEGRSHIGVGSPEHVIYDVEQGGSLRMIGGNVNVPTHDLIAQPEIKTLTDLRGRLLGVSSLSGGTSSLFIEILERAGLKYPEDFRMVAAGVVPPRHTKLLNREIDACMQTDPHNYIAEDAGFSNLGPVKSWIPFFQFTSINVRADWAAAHRDEVVRFLVASIQASHWMAENDEEAIALAVEKMGVEERYARRAWHDHVDTDALPLDLDLNPISIETALDMIRKDRAATIKVSDESDWQCYVDQTYLAEAHRRLGMSARHPAQTAAG
jgi:NitT/TauT family transport system substrate-binding protein